MYANILNFIKIRIEDRVSNYSKLTKALLFKQTLFYFTMKRKSFSLYNIYKKLH